MCRTSERIFLNLRELNLNNLGSIVHLQYPPALIHFCTDDHSPLSLQGLENGIIPLEPSDQTIQLNDIDNKVVLISRCQYSFMLAYALTDYKSQGQMLEHAIVDIGPVPNRELSPFNAYVTLSRGRGRENIQLLHNFSKKKFDHHPCKELRDEDEWLEGLNKQTNLLYNEGHFMY
jgi:hypothetical protein